MVNVLMVGNALDTNGQKGRFVEAARRWGDDTDVLKALIVGKWDGAGIPTRFAEAAEKGEGLSIRSAHRATAYFDFPTDIVWSRRTHQEVRQLAEQADVVHLTNDVKAYLELRLPKMSKPAVLHHHGTLFRSLHDNGASRARLLGEAKRFHMVQAVSTIDLLRHAPEVLHWLPAPIDVDAMQQIRADNRRPDDGVVRIVSAPTRRDLKSTERLIAAVECLKAEGLPVELVLVESRSWAECLAVKGSADIYFDQVAAPEHDYPGGYGCNAIEAWAMGIPVIAGADEWTTGRMHQEFGDLPYMHTEQDHIADSIRALVEAPKTRAAYGKRGLAHVEKYHAEKPALQRLAHLYAEAIRVRQEAGTEPVPVERTGPGVFSSMKPELTMRFGSHMVQFTEHIAEVQNPDIAQRLRRYAAMVPSKGIAEVYADG